MATLAIPVRRAITACLAVPVVLGGAALFGWVFAVPALRHMLLSRVPMAPLTAICFVLVPLGLWARLRWPEMQWSRRCAAFVAAAVALSNATVLLQTSLGWQSSLEALIIRAFAIDISGGGGFMSPMSSVNFLIASVALLPAASRGKPSPAVREAGLWAALAEAAFGVTVLLGYVYSAPLFSRTGVIPVALSTAICFLALGVIGLITADRQAWLVRNLTGDSTRSRLLRMFLPGILFFVVLEDWIAFYLTREQFLNPALMSLLFSLLTAVLVAALAFWAARHVGRALDRSQEALRDSEERYRSLFDCSGDGVMLLKLGAGFPLIIEANETALKAYGYTRKELIGQPVSLLEPELTAEAASERLRRMAGQGPADLRPRRKDGTVLELEAVARWVTLGDDEMIMTVQRDVSERRRAEHELREAAEFSRQIIEHARDGMIVLDKDLRYRAWNRRMTEMSGTPAEETLGRPALDAFPFLRRREFAARLQLALAGMLPEAMDFSFMAPGADGVRWFSDQVGPLRDAEGGIAGVIVSVRDVTDRKEAEEAIRESARMSQTILDCLPCVALLMRPRSREIAALNKRAAERDSRGGKPCCESWAHSSKPCPFCFAPGIWEKGEPLHRVIEWTGAVWDAHWVPVASDLYMYYAFDITERIRGEEERERLQAQLIQSQKMESIGRLAGGVAHDFNNLLTVINGYSEMALAQAGPEHPLAGPMEQIRHAGERAAALTQQLLAFSRKQILQPRILDLNHVVSGMRPMLERMMGEDVEIRLDLHAGEVWVHADPHQLEQVIMNLAVNARDAMPRGGSLSIATAAGEGADRGAVLTVSDSGTGMDAAVRQRIFEPFFTTKRPGEGTGLGLSMVQGIIAQSGGQIEVHSELGLGTTFEIRLPAQVQAVSDGAAASAAPVLGGTETILLVEDQPEVLRFAATVLSEYGYRVIQADCAADALQLSKREVGRIDLLLTDVVMPQVSGRELAAQMRELRPGIRILFMSGHTGDLILDHGALDAGVQFLQKPFTPGELAERVRAALALRSV